MDRIVVLLLGAVLAVMPLANADEPPPPDDPVIIDNSETNSEMNGEVPPDEPEEDPVPEEDQGPIMAQ